MRSRRALPFAVLALCAADPLHDSAEDTIRAANAAFQRKDAAAAEKLYAAAEERTADPGLVAFNTATLLFQKDDFRDAELHYRRAIEDKACPHERAAKAWFNRGTCLVRRGGSAGVFRSAVACFERCLELEQTEPAPRRHIDEIVWHSGLLGWLYRHQGRDSLRVVAFIVQNELWRFLDGISRVTA